MRLENERIKETETINECDIKVEDEVTFKFYNRGYCSGVVTDISNLEKDGSLEVYVPFVQNTDNGGYFIIQKTDILENVNTCTTIKTSQDETATVGDVVLCKTYDGEEYSGTIAEIVNDDFALIEDYNDLVNGVPRKYIIKTMQKESDDTNDRSIFGNPYNF